MKKISYLFVVGLSFTLLMSACSSGGEEAVDETGDTTEEVVTEESPEVVEEAPESDVVQIEINSNDQMKFDKDELRVPAGSTVELTLHHVGKMAENVMGHNVVILKTGVDMADFATAAMQAKESNFVPSDRESDVIAHTEVIGGGESTSITFEAPEAGTYDFICSFPGHYSVMNGKFIVE